MGWMRTQPRGPIQVDASNPLSRGLMFAQTGSSDAGFASINGVTVIPFVVGEARSFSSASLQYLLATDDKIRSGPLTFFCIARPSIVSNNRALMSIGASTNDRTALYITSGRAALFSGAGSTTGQAISATFPAGVVYNFGGRVNATNSRDVWINGVLAGSNASTVSPQPANRIAIGAIWASGAPVANQYFDGSMQLALAWNRALSDDEMRSLAANPWQLFIEPEELDDYAAAVEAVTGTFATTADSGAMVAVGMVGNVVQGSLSAIGDNGAMLSAGIILNRGVFSSSGNDGLMAAFGSIAMPVSGAFAAQGQDGTFTASGYNGIPPELVGTIARRRIRPRVYSKGPQQ